MVIKVLLPSSTTRTSARSRGPQQGLEDLSRVIFTSQVKKSPHSSGQIKNVDFRQSTKTVILVTQD